MTHASHAPKKLST